MKVYLAAQKNYNKFMYADTDSIHCENYGEFMYADTDSIHCGNYGKFMYADTDSIHCMNKKTEKGRVIKSNL